MIQSDQQYNLVTSVVLPDGNGGFTPCPELLTEDELINFLRIPEISGSQNYHNVIEHLKKVRGLPRIHICHKVLYPKKAVLKWVENETDVGK
jgi:hypothetical protein